MMKQSPKLISHYSLFLALFILSLPAPPAQAQSNAARPEVWMSPPAAPDGKCFRELFEHPDQWQETRSLIDVLFYTDLNLKKQFTDEELKAWLPKLNEWGIKLGMEVGAIKPWGKTGEKTFNIERPLWERVERLGGRIHAIAMDEPLCCARKEIHQPDNYAVQETANYIALVGQHFPKILIGDIEPYPFIQLPDLIAWIDVLQARLKQMNVRGLDFFRVDVDWNHFTIGNRIYPGNWPEIRKLEQACRLREIPFSLIYWAADYGRMKQLNLADDAAWYLGVMRQGNDYAFVDGHPDQYVIESWIGAPSRSVPETDEWTFTRSVRDFTKRFVKQKR